MADKVYTNEVVPENPYPGEVVESTVVTSSQEGKGDIYTSSTTKEKTYPTRKIATELIGSALNTRSKKVLQEFELVQSGGFKVGNYQAGVSGEVSYTPVGIVAKNKSGILTVVIDGEAGDAIFRGTLQTGAIISGIVSVGDDSIVIDGETKRQVWYDDDGIPVIVIGNA